MEKIGQNDKIDEKCKIEKLDKIKKLDKIDKIGYGKENKSIEARLRKTIYILAF